jgi:hypothetical protein
MTMFEQSKIRKGDNQKGGQGRSSSPIVPAQRTEEKK